MNSCLTITKPQYSLSVSLLSLLLFVNISNYIFLLWGREHNCHGPGQCQTIAWRVDSLLPPCRSQIQKSNHQTWRKEADLLSQPTGLVWLTSEGPSYANFWNVCTPHQAFLCCSLRSFYHSIQQPEGLLMYY